MRSNRCFGMGAGVAVVIALLASQAVAQYTPVPLKMTYSLGLGGDNHAAAWKANTPQLYSGANPAQGQQLCGDVVNWAVLVQVEGDHLGKLPGTETNYYRTFGAANLVFNVELHQGTVDGPLVTTAQFESTINDGTGSDPTAAAAFAVSYQTLTTSNAPGRLIDTRLENGPRLEPIFTYPYYNPAEGLLIGMGCGYKEWIRSGDLSLITVPGVGMTQIPNTTVVNGVGTLRAGLGVVPIAEGQINMSSLAAGTYVLKVVPGKGNNVLRGDMAMYETTNRPAFAIGLTDDQVVGGSISFTRTGEECVGPCEGVVGRHIFYNNSAWDGNTPGIVVPGDYNAIAPNKTALLQGQTATFANYTSFSSGINGIIVDACHFNRLPVVGEDIVFLMGNAQGDPTGWAAAPDPNAMVLRPGEGANGSDRLIITWADNAIPRTKWLLVALLAFDPELGLPDSDVFMFGNTIGDVQGNFAVNGQDELGIRSHYTGLGVAAIDNIYDINRDKKVNGTDELKARANYTGLAPLVPYIFNPIW